MSPRVMRTARYQQGCYYDVSPQGFVSPFAVFVPFADWMNRIVTLAIFNENLSKGIIVRSCLWRDKLNVFPIKEADDCQINYLLSVILFFF